MIITAGIYKGRQIDAPDEKITRPTLSKTRMGVFNTLYSILGDFEGKSFLDLFGGSGIMGLEAISRGFSRVKVFEKNKKAAETILHNYRKLNIKPELTVGDSLKLLKKLDEIFDVVYIDPPYQSNLYESVLQTVNGRLIVVESTDSLNCNNFKIIKQKVYGSSTITYMQKQ